MLIMGDMMSMPADIILIMLIHGNLLMEVFQTTMYLYFYMKNKKKI